MHKYSSGSSVTPGHLCSQLYGQCAHTHSKASGSYASSLQHLTIGAPTHDAVSVVAKEQGVLSIVKPPGVTRRGLWDMLLAEVGNNSLSHGLGSDPGQSPSSGNLERPTSLLAHKLPGDKGMYFLQFRFFLPELRGYHVLV